MIAMLARTVTVVVPDPTFMNRLAALVLVSASGIAVGGSLSLVVEHWHDIRVQVEDARDYFWARLGFALAIGLLAILVAENPVVDAGDWRLIVFTVGIIMCARGYGNLVRKNVVESWQRRKEKR